MVEHRQCITALFCIVVGGKSFLRNFTQPCPPVDVRWNLTAASLLGSTLSPVLNTVPCTAGQLFCYSQGHFFGHGSLDVTTMILVTNTLWLRRGGFMKRTAMCCSWVKQVLITLITAGLWVWHFTVKSLIIWAGWFLIINCPNLKRN